MKVFLNIIFNGTTYKYNVHPSCYCFQGNTITYTIARRVQNRKQVTYKPAQYKRALSKGKWSISLSLTLHYCLYSQISVQISIFSFYFLYILWHILSSGVFVILIPVVMRPPSSVGSSYACLVQSADAWGNVRPVWRYGR